MRPSFLFVNELVAVIFLVVNQVRRYCFVPCAVGDCDRVAGARKIRSDFKGHGLGQAVGGEEGISGKLSGGILWTDLDAPP